MLNTCIHLVYGQIRATKGDTAKTAPPSPVETRASELFSLVANKKPRPLAGALSFTYSLIVAHQRKLLRQLYFVLIV